MRIDKNNFPCEIECIAIETHSELVKTFYFYNQKCFEFSAGQFINLVFVIDQKKYIRSYTISSPSTNPFVISITVKKEGLVSGWLFDKFQVGQTLTAKSIDGVFVFPKQKKPTLFVSGGIGITPALSMLQTLLELKSRHLFLLIHFDAQPLFHKKISSNHYQKVIFINPRKEGYFSLNLLKRLGINMTEYNVFCCGPEPLYEAVQSLATQLNLPSKQLFHENFLSKTAQTLDETFEVQCDELDVNIPCHSHQSILNAFSEQQISLPYGCAAGVCGACKMKLLKGKVTMQDNGGISPQEKEQGYFLPCCSTPQSHLAVAPL